MSTARLAAPRRPEATTAQTATRLGVSEPTLLGMFRNYFGFMLIGDRGQFDRLPLVGLVEIAKMFGKAPDTVRQWRRPNRRDRRDMTLPEPACRISGTPLWTVPAILAYGYTHGHSVTWNPSQDPPVRGRNRLRTPTPPAAPRIIAVTVSKPGLSQVSYTGGLP